MAGIRVAYFIFVDPAACPSATGVMMKSFVSSVSSLKRDASMPGPVGGMYGLYVLGAGEITVSPLRCLITLSTNAPSVAGVSLLGWPWEYDSQKCAW